MKLAKKPFQMVFGVVFTLLFFGYICSIGIKNIFRYNEFLLEYAEKKKELFALLDQNKKYKSLFFFNGNERILGITC